LIIAHLGSLARLTSDDQGKAPSHKKRFSMIHH
jgi:hypothetical protein